MKKVLFVVLILIASTLNAQWSDNPEENTLIAGGDGEQSVPHIVKTSESNYYVSYYSNASGNYDVYLHYIDASGEAIWDNPLLISDNSQNSWVTDYALAVDNEDNALISFNDVRNGNLDIFIYKVDEEGNQQWGDDGIQLSTSSLEDYVPSLAVTEGNNVVAAWTVPEDSTIVLQKITPDGDLLWGANGNIIEPTGDYYNDYPYIIPMNGEKLYVNYSHVNGPYWAPDRDMFMQLIDNNGDNLWANEVEIFNAGGLSGLTKLSNYLTDDKLLCFAWHDDRANDMISDPYLQCIDSTGSLLYTANGVLLSNAFANNQFAPQIAGVNADDDIVIFWTETDGDQNNRGVYGQKIAYNGTLNWGSNGKEFSALGTVISFLNCYLDEDEVTYFYNKPVGTFDGLYAHRVDAVGDFIWDAEVELAATDKEKTHTDIIQDMNSEQFVAVWGEDRSSSRDLFAQNLNYDGTLGVPAINWEAEITEFSINSVVGVIDDVSKTITIDLGDVDTTMFIAEFTLSEGASAFINNEEQESGVSVNEFTSGEALTYTVVSFDESVTNDWSVTVTYNHIGVEELALNINIYPNPSKDIIYLDGLMNAKVKLQNAYGQIFYSTEINSEKHQIDVREMNSGMYIVTIEQEGVVKTKKILIRH